MTTARHHELLKIIEDHHARYGYAPSVRDLQTATGWSSMSALHRALVALRSDGLIEWDTHRYRTIRPVQRT